MVWLTRIFGALKNEINNKYGLNSLSLPFEMSNEFPRCMSHQVLYRQKWVEVGISKYLDQEGRERNWDVVSRTTSKSGVLGAVDIIAIVLNRAELRGVEKQTWKWKREGQVIRNEPPNSCIFSSYWWLNMVQKPPRERIAVQRKHWLLFD